MSKQRLIILGAGISGLSLAWYLSHHSDQYEIIVLEKSHRVGGWIRSEKVGDFFFEKGPHTFAASRSDTLLALAHEVGLSEERIDSDSAAQRRFLYYKKALRSLPKWPLIKSFCREWRIPRQSEEETVHAFATRRFGKEVAELLFDPMALGIYAGDARHLSMSACFPFFKGLETRYGSIIRGVLPYLFRRRNKGLFSFKKGVAHLTEALAEKCKGVVHLEQQALSLRFTPLSVEVITQDSVWEGAHVFCTLDPIAAASLFTPHDPESAPLWNIPLEEVTLVTIGFNQKVLSKKGFGYLVPTQENQKILGVIFDSEIFPQQNEHPEETRLSVLMRGNQQSQERALEALRDHLGIRETPQAIATTTAFIPQYHLGHQQKIADLQERIKTHFPRCSLLGNYLGGVSVNDCIRLAQETATAYAINPTCPPVLAREWNRKWDVLPIPPDRAWD